jgi:hypothetical protein
MQSVQALCGGIHQGAMVITIILHPFVILNNGPVVVVSMRVMEFLKAVE